MASNIAGLVGAVVRAVEKRERDGKTMHAVIATATYDTDVDDLWDALSNPERIPRWFLPVTGELRVGGRYQLVGNAGGTILACEPPRHLAVTWEFGGGVTWVTVDLAQDGKGRSSLRLEHIAEVGGDLWDQFGPGAVGVGWDLSLHALGRHLRGEVVEAAESQAWLATQDGKAFVAGTSNGWRDASIAFGTPQAKAEAAAAATTAFYLGGGDA